MRIVPLGDQAALTYFREEAAALQMSSFILQNRPPWLIDLVQSYASIALYFDLGEIRFLHVKHFLEEVARAPVESTHRALGRLHTIPCCYEMSLDIERVAEYTHLSQEKIIELHTGCEYTVYAIGFCPGFPFLGYLPKELSNVPRLPTPRVRVEEGSVGLTGRQTGIYTQVRPGGWNLIGRTPLQLVDVEEEYFPLRTGDRVRFKRIDEKEFRRLKGERLKSG